MQTQCPIHNLPIEVSSEDGRQVAICSCNVPNNQHSGIIVWVKYPDAVKEESSKSPKPLKSKE